MIVNSLVVARQDLPKLQGELLRALEVYRKKTPHPIPSDQELWDDWVSPGGDEVFAFGTEGEFAGFMTFKVQRLPGVDELWGTIAILFVKDKFQHGDVLSQAAEQLTEILRARGCQVMNYMTARKGFKRLAPRLGFHPRIIEWMKEL